MRLKPSRFMQDADDFLACREGTAAGALANRLTWWVLFVVWLYYGARILQAYLAGRFAL